MFKRIIFLGLVFSLIFILAAACTNSFEEEDGNDENVEEDLNSNGESESVTRVSYEELPQEVKAWVDSSREMTLAQDKVFGERRYILVTYGEKPTGGYSVEINRIQTETEAIEVYVEFTKPTSDQYVTTALTYPYDIAYIESSPQPLNFNPTGDEEFIMTLKGIDELQPIVASSPLIKLFSPHPTEETGLELTVSGVANVYEGTIQYRFLNSEGNIADEGYITAGMGNWYYFQERLKVPKGIVSGSDYHLEIYAESGKDGKEENEITLTLKK